MARKPTVFLREATGLVREFSWVDSAMYNMISCPMLIGVTWWFLFTVPWAFPGGDVYVGFLAFIPIVIFYTLNYILLQIAMPRSGGDYIFSSRIVHPVWGLMNTMAYVVIGSTFGGGLYAFSVVAFYLSPFLYSYGTILNNPALTNFGASLTNPNLNFIFGLLFLAIAVLLNTWGTRVYARFQRYFFAVMIAGTVLWLGVLLFSSQSGFISAFNVFAARFGTSYDGIIATAKQNGYGVTGYSLPMSLGVTSYMFMVAITAWSTYLGGELKQVHTNAILGLSVGNIGLFTVFVVATTLIFHTFGKDFVYAMVWLYHNNPTAYPFPVAPEAISFLTAIMYPNVALGMFMAIVALFYNIIYLGALALQVSRTVFAWSFDRILPAKLGEVNDKFHSPIPSLLFFFFASAFFLAIFTYAGWALLWLVGIYLWAGSFLFPSFAGMVFPFTRKSLFESSPPLVNKKIGPIPLVTIAGGGAFLGILICLILYLTNPLAAGVIPLEATLFSFGVYLSGIVIYLVAYFYRKREGINIGLAFRELPPE